MNFRKKKVYIDIKHAFFIVLELHKIIFIHVCLDKK